MKLHAGTWLAGSLLLFVPGTEPVRAALPAWVQEAVEAPTPPEAARADAWLVEDEQHVTVPRSGRIVTLQRGAVRILTRGGKHEARCDVVYLRGSSEVRAIQGWLVSPNGKVKRQGRADMIDSALAGVGTLYSEARLVSLVPEDAEVGSLYAWESELEEDPLIAQWKWHFDGRLPARRSRFSLTLPSGLTPRVEPIHAEGMVSRQSGNTWTWERSAIPARPREPMAVVGWRSGSGLDVEVVGADRVTPAGRSLRAWGEVATWLDQLAADRATLTPEIRARAAAVTAGLTDTLAQMAALARDVQRLNYVSVAMGLGRGHGFRPHAAADVLRLGYGDCKDKANLLRALLHARGFDAWLVPVYWGARSRVDAAWPSPSQFNHCIVAMRAPAGASSPAAFQHPTLGTLLAFDATDDLTAFGDLPEEQQGSLALLVDAKAGSLVTLPVVGPDRNRLERVVDATLDPDGRLSARLVERSQGQMAVRQRRFARGTSAATYRQGMEARLARSGGSVVLREVSTREDTVAGSFHLQLAYDVPLFARARAGGLLTFRPDLAHGRIVSSLPDSARRGDIELDSECVTETVRVRLPAGYVLDEAPRALKRETDFGSLEADWRAEGDTLSFTRRWWTRPGRLPAARYPEVREFYGALAATTQAQVVLLRRP